MIKAVIFDLDGTLVDSNDLHVEAWDRAFRKYGKTFSHAELKHQVGKGSDQYLPAFLSREEIERFGKELDEYRTCLFQTEYLSRVRPFPKVRELFERIVQDGKRIALATSGKGKELQSYKNLLGIRDLVDGEMTSDDADRSKPAPDLFAASLQKLKLGAVEVIAVGDTPYDVIAAGRVGIATIGLLCGGFPREELQKAGAIAIYADPADLLLHYEQSPLAY